MRTEARNEPTLGGPSAPLASRQPTPGQQSDSALKNGGTQPGPQPANRSETLEPLAFNPLRASVVIALAATALGWDLYSKWAVFADLGYPGNKPVWKGSLLGIATRFELATSFNFGALWGAGQGMTWLFASLSVVAVGVILWFLWNGQATANAWLMIVTGLLLAGTLGNLYDRLGLHGWKDANGKTVCAVRDFLDFWFFNDGFHWATFNFADTYLVTGAIMLVAYSFVTPPTDQPEASTQPAASGGSTSP